MARIYNFGSLCIEHIYQVSESDNNNPVAHSPTYHRAPGGKGFYQSIAMARAGATVSHVGFIGPEGRLIKKSLTHNSVDTQHIYQVDHSSGQHFIQSDDDGSKRKVLYHGANHAFEAHFIDSILKSVQTDDLLLIQNEINDIPCILEQAKTAGHNITFHPSPWTPDIVDYPLECVDTLIFNLNAGQRLTQQQSPGMIMQTLLARLPHTALILTLGAQGAWYQDHRQKIKVPADPVYAIDENQAGNTFVGFYLAHKLKQYPIESCLKFACRASALCVTRQGQSATIPYVAEMK